MTIQKAMLVFLVAATFIFSASCEKEIFGCIKGEGSKETRTIEIDDTIHGFALFGDSDLTIVEGDSQMITVHAHPNIIDQLAEDSRVDDGIWHFGIDKCVRGSFDIDIVATVSSLTDVSLSGSGKIQTEGVFDNVVGLNIDLSGSGNIRLDLGDNLSSIRYELSGSGNCTLSGATEVLQIDLSGSGNVNSFDLISQQCDIDLSGSGDCDVFVEALLDVDLSGSGDVCYRGNPPVINQDIDGSGSLRDCN